MVTRSKFRTDSPHISSAALRRDAREFYAFGFCMQIKLVFLIITEFFLLLLGQRNVGTYSEASIRLEQTRRINKHLRNLEDVCTEHICVIKMIGIFIIIYHVLHRHLHHTITETHTNFRSRNFSILTKIP